MNLLHLRRLAIFCCLCGVAIPIVVSRGAQTGGTLICAGSTFAAPIYDKWIRSFPKESGWSIRHEAIGSEAGLAALKRKEADFAASDFIPPEWQKAPVYLVPSVIGAAVPAYNVPNVQQDLRFTPSLLAAIYLGKITKWNDPAIVAINRGVDLPAENISVVHRSDGSGTTFIWTDFLSRANPEWRGQAGAGFQPKWPEGRAAAGNDGVAELIEKTPHSLGYVEFIYALKHRLSYGSVKNPAGKFVAANIDSLTAAAEAAQGDGDSISILNATGRNAYPVAAFTWLVIPKQMAPGERREELRSFLLWMLEAGQKQVAALGYVPLPAELAERERERVQHFWQ
jgi:phosphate transport system substrate-binding protein